jgi:hypothetical protein
MCPKFTAEVHFSDKNGEHKKTFIFAGLGTSIYKLNQKVDIIYNVDSPNRTVANTFEDIWGLEIMGALALLIIILIDMYQLHLKFLHSMPINFR